MELWNTFKFILCCAIGFFFAKFVLDYGVWDNMMMDCSRYGGDHNFKEVITRCSYFRWFMEDLMIVAPMHLAILFISGRLLGALGCFLSTIASTVITLFIPGIFLIMTLLVPPVGLVIILSTAANIIAVSITLLYIGISVGIACWMHLVWEDKN